MRLLIPIVAAVLALSLPEGGGASATTRLDVSPKHGYSRTSYVISFRAEYASSKATKSQYVIGAVNSNNCTHGVSSFGKIKSGPYRVGQTVRFRVHFPNRGLCLGVYHGVAHYEKKAGDHYNDRRVGRFAFRVLNG